MAIKKPTRAWIQTRISDDRTGEGLGVERHEHECRVLCDRRGWVVVGCTVENSVSAATTGRKGLIELLGRIEKREFDILVTWAADRLVRSLADLERVIEACQHNGVKIATVSGDLDLSTDAGRLVARILASVARGELERKSARFRSRFEQSLRDGTPVGGAPRRFGYKQGNIEIDPVEAALLREAYDRWNAGATLGDVTRWLTARGSTTPKGRAWTTSSLRRVLANPANAGLRGTLPLLADGDGRPLLTPQGIQRRGEWHEIVGPATWPGVVDEATWRTALSRLQDPTRQSGRSNTGRKWLLSGIARCATCDLVMKTKTNNQQRSLSCPTNGHATRKAEPVETYVRDIILERLRQRDARDLLKNRAPGVDVGALVDERDSITKRMRVIARDEVLGRRTRDEALAAREVADERLTEINAMLAAAGKVSIVARFLADGVDPEVVWNSPSTTLSMKQELIDALAVVRIGSGRNGRPAKYSEDMPPPNVTVDFRSPVERTS